MNSQTANILVTALFLTSIASTSLAQSTQQPKPATHPAKIKLPERHVITGIVTNANGRGIQAMVFIFDADTGLPYSNVTDHPFTNEGDLGTRVVSGNDGRFSIPGIFPGNYRLFAQSWQGGKSTWKLSEIDGNTTTLCGVANNITVTENQQPPFIILNPVGTATVDVTFDANDTFLLVSTHPLTGDALLHHMAWKGDFLQHLVGVTYMRKKFASLHGLPAAPLYFYALYNRDGDEPDQFGHADTIAQAGEISTLKIPLISPSNGKMKLPDPLQLLQTTIKKDGKAYHIALLKVLPKGSENPQTVASIDWPLDTFLSPPRDPPITVRDFFTIAAYADFNAQAQEWALHHPPASQPAQR